MMDLIDGLKQKAKQSTCRHRVAAIALSKKGNVLGKTTNRCRFSKYHGGEHAEMRLMRRYGTKIKTIIICRVNKSGRLLPIDPCLTCASVAKYLKIQIISVR